jgi:hypothetical protein
MSNGHPGRSDVITLGSSNGAIQVEAVDFAKVKRKFAQLDRLKEVGLEAERIATLSAPEFAPGGTENANEDAAAILARKCPCSCVIPLPCLHRAPSIPLLRSNGPQGSPEGGCAEAATPLSGSGYPSPAPIFHILLNVTDLHIFYSPSCAVYCLFPPRTDPFLPYWRYSSDGRSSDLTPTYTILKFDQYFSGHTFLPKHPIRFDPNATFDRKIYRGSICLATLSHHGRRLWH